MMEVKLSGRLDENVQLPKIPKPLNGELHINLARIEGINSVGCREWAQWIQDLFVTGGIFLHQCPPHFIAQMSILVSAFPQYVTVRSVYVPYYCESCGAEELMLIECAPNVRSPDQLNVPPQIICPVCSASMRLDVVKQKFFSFLTLNAA